MTKTTHVWKETIFFTYNIDDDSNSNILVVFGCRMEFPFYVKKKHLFQVFWFFGFLSGFSVWILVFIHSFIHSVKWFVKSFFCCCFSNKQKKLYNSIFSINRDSIEIWTKNFTRKKTTNRNFLLQVSQDRFDRFVFFIIIIIIIDINRHHHHHR